jgi:hypothetical protein
VPATSWDITIEQGATWATSLILTDRDLTGCTARMQIRETVLSPSTLLSLTSDPEAGITVTAGPPGVIAITITAAQTAAMTWKHGVYDLELVSPNGTVERLLKGDVSVDFEVTR